jgi:hypothetical protein
MSTIIEILRSTEEVQLPDGTRTLASEEALRQTLRESSDTAGRLHEAASDVAPTASRPDGARSS